MRKILSFDNVCYNYTLKKGFFKKEKYFVLKDISFDLYHGETLGVIGRNGAGKSTLLRLIAGTMYPKQGRIYREEGTNASLLSLNLANFPNLTGYENVIMQSMFLGYSKSYIEAKIDAIKKFADIGEWFYKPVRTYSSGMAAKIKFATALEMQSDIILIDEILGVGDKEFKIKSSKAMKSFIKEDNQSAVLVSHHSNTVREVCDKVLWIENSRIKMFGDVNEVMDKYDTSS